MKRETAMAMVDEFRSDWHRNRAAMTELDKWHRGDHERPSVPRDRDGTEAKRIAARASTPWLRLVVSQVVQSMFVDGYHTDVDAENTRPWRIWQANGFDKRQIAVHRGMVSLGRSYVSEMPGMVGDDAIPVVRGHSARNMVAYYQDPASDEWPDFALAGQVMNPDDTTSMIRWTLLDEEAEWTIDQRTGTDALEYVTHREHNAGVCPVVRFTNELDLEGRVTGDVEPYIPIVKRTDQTVNDRLVVQRYASWVVKTIAGMEKPDTEAEARAEKLRLEVEDILVSSSPDTKFGTLQPTQLDGFIRAKKSDLEDLAAASQTDPLAFSGEAENISAEALDTLRASATGKLIERRMSAGESHEQWLRLGAHMAGWEGEAADFSSEVSWRDLDNRVLSKVMDALGKAAEMLHVPYEMLWEEIPGWDATKVARAKAARSTYNPLTDLEGVFERQAAGRDVP